MPAEILVGFGGRLRVVGELLLDLAAAMFAPRALDHPLEFA
jgi:hypothetical protein